MKVLKLNWHAVGTAGSVAAQGPSWRQTALLRDRRCIWKLDLALLCLHYPMRFAKRSDAKRVAEQADAALVAAVASPSDDVDEEIRL